MSRKWTDEEVYVLRDMWAKGYSRKIIASKMDRTLASIDMKRKKIGIPEHASRWNIERPVGDYVRVWFDGKDMAQIRKIAHERGGRPGTIIRGIVIAELGLK